MAILAGFIDVKPGTTYQGVAVKYVAVDTKKRYHLMPFGTGSLDTPKAVAVISGDSTVRPEMTDQEKADAYWLWDAIPFEEKT